MWSTVDQWQPASGLFDIDLIAINVWSLNAALSILWVPFGEQSQRTRSVAQEKPLARSA